jgi:GNAT superfamily N-acetyltransferase
MDREWKNVLRRAQHPSFAVRLLLFFVREINFRLRSLVTSQIELYPAPVRRVLYRMPQGTRLAIAHSADEASAAPAAACSSHPDTLRLAVGELSYSGMPDWRQTFEDPEQTVSLHRWNWLLTKLIDDPSRSLQPWGLALIRDWLAHMSADASGLAWESYTTSERICNSILFMSLSRQSDREITDLPPDLLPALRRMAYFLSERMEYSRPPWTGNHVINNARALYFAGRVLKDDWLRDLALAVFRSDLPSLVNSDGFLREGSSHYHFLIARWLLEVVWLAELTGDSETSDLISPFARSMVERCWFFLVFDSERKDWLMPLIGDVSPDFSWQWLLDLPWSPLAKKFYQPEAMPPPPRLKGWGHLFGETKPVPVSSPVEESQALDVFEFPVSGWYRLDWGPLKIFWHAEPQGAPPFASHGHCDIGSFNVHWKGVEILSDPGRLNYELDNPLGRYGMEARAHNTVVVDGFDPFVYYNRNRLPEFYRKGNVDIQFGKHSDGCKVCLRHDGFSRLAGDKITLTRWFLVERGRLVIHDEFQGQSQHLIETLFQWAPGVVLSRKEGGVGVTHKAGFQADFSVQDFADGGELNELVFEVLRGESKPQIAGWYFPGYGMKEETSTLAFSELTALPYTRRYCLSWEN